MPITQIHEVEGGNTKPSSEFIVEEEEEERGLIVLHENPSVETIAELKEIYSQTTQIFSGQFDPEEQIKRIAKRAHEITIFLHVNMLELGMLLEQARDVTYFDVHSGRVVHLYDGAGYPDMKSWCTAMGIPAEFRRTAIELYKAAPYLLKLGYSVAEICGSIETERPEEARLKITALKAQVFSADARDYNRQVTEAELAKRTIEAELAALTQKPLPSPQRELLRVQIQERLAGVEQQMEQKKADMRERADLILKHWDDAAILAEKQQQSGRVEPTRLWYNASFSPSGQMTFTCTVEHPTSEIIEQLGKGRGIEGIWQVKGVDGSFSTSEMMAHIKSLGIHS